MLCEAARIGLTLPLPRLGNVAYILTRRRPRRVPGVLRQLPLELLNPRGQLLDLTIHPQQHLDHNLATRVIDRSRLIPLHTTTFDNANLCPPDQLNAYKNPPIWRAFLQAAEGTRTLDLLHGKQERIVQL